MAAIFTPDAEKEFFTPFGPLMGYFRMPALLISALNDAVSDKLEDHSGQLVGKVREELRFDKPLIDLAAAHLGQTLIEYHVRASHRGAFGDYNHREKQFELNIMGGWFVRQFAGDYNPLHIHTGASISCVGYLALPDGMEAEWEEDYRDHHPSHGHLQFAHGTDVHYSVSNFMIKPRVGDVYIFPSHMFHCV
ncbi:MAG: putative 2OG-Fe(II) oxygenase, partial [Henriciella sp.]|uniref:putative 2OG-Fe(II) oxygenase n=1 Tax=Henriciella sp. TaxID=1968823 RepID=UPI003C768472